MSKVLIFATGGTIAGKSNSEVDLTGYTAGALSGEELVKAIPEISQYGNIEVVAFSNIDSSDMTLAKWRDLACLVEKRLHDEDVVGAIILHGTDTMEEGAYFLHLTVHTNKPVVVTGAMRPASSIGPDGPMNIVQSLQVVTSKDAIGKGVLVVFDGMIYGARDVQKWHTTSMNAFGNPIYGALGVVQDGIVEFVQKSVKKHTQESVFSVANVETFPLVEIVYTYGGIENAVFEASLARKPEAIVLAGMGHGVLPKGIRKVANRAYPVIIRASRVMSGKVSALPQDGMGSILHGGTLSAPKLRILLSLALLITKQPEELQVYIDTY